MYGAGSYRRVTSVKDASCFLGTFEISKDFMRQSMRIYHPENTFHYPEKLEIKLFLVGAVALANIFCWAAALLYAQMGAKIGSAHL